MRSIHLSFFIHLSLSISIAVSLITPSCMKNSSHSGESINETLTEELGERAGSADQVALNNLQTIQTTVAPAGIRPDPDLFAKRLLLMFNKPSTTLVKEIGRIEDFRALLGGGSEDLKTPPAESYDATSMLALMKVAEEICTSLIAPTPNLQPGWSSILPAPPSDTDTNIRFLIQRFEGIPTSKITASDISDLKNLLNTSQGLTYSSYIPVCQGVAIHSGALLL